MTEVLNIRDIEKRYYQTMIDDMYIEHEPDENGGRYNIKISTKEVKRNVKTEYENARRGISTGDEFNQLLQNNLIEFIDKIHIKLISPDSLTTTENAPDTYYTMTLQLSADEEDIDRLHQLCKNVEDAYAKWLSEMNC